MYVSPGVVGCWQGAIRDVADPDHDALLQAITSGDLIAVDLLYGDRDAGPRSISRFVLEQPDGADQWLTSVVPRWSIDGPHIGEYSGPAVTCGS